MSKPMMIDVKYPTRCHSCDAPIAVGERALWTGRGIVYGLGCHVSLRERRKAAKLQAEIAEKGDFLFDVTNPNVFAA